MPLDLIPLLSSTTLATTAAITLVLLLRRPMRAAFGAGTAYGLWALVPIALMAVLLPAPVRPVLLMPVAVKIGAAQAITAAPMAWSVPWAWVLVSAWASGALAMACLQLWQQRRFLQRLGPLRVHAHGLRVASTSAGLPAVTGVLRPRIVLPADFLVRYDADERALVVAHERQHIARGDLPCNALVALLRCVYWFNPLLHWAVARYRHDQELACDARVIARHPHARLPYAQAMLKTQLDGFALPVGCHWHTHPIKERIAMLKRPSPRRWQTGLSSALLLALFCCGGYAAWAQQPASASGGRAASTSSPDQYGAALQLEVGSERHRFQMQRPAQAPFSFSVDTQSGQHWQGTLSVAPFAQDQVRVDVALKRDGVEIGSPMMIVAGLGEEASIKLEPGAGEHAGSAGFVLAVRIKELAQEPLSRAAAGKEGPAPQPRMRQVADQQPARVQDSAGLFDDAQHPAPRYPKEAADAHITGRVVMLVDIAADGSVSDVVIDHAQPVGVFEAVSLEAVRKWKFLPVLENGKPVAHRVRVPIDFDMDPPGAAPASGVAKPAGIAWYAPKPEAQGLQRRDCDALRGSMNAPMACGDRVPDLAMTGDR
jgi:TonB family protein